MVSHRYRFELAILLTCVIGSIILHAVSLVTVFGEPDAARLAVLAVEWRETGRMANYHYEVRTSPLYIHGIKLLMDSGVRPSSIPLWINWVNIIIGSLTLIPLYFLWRRLASRAAAAIACVFISVAPAFWLASLYGMPHLVAFALFITALLVWVQALERAKALSWWLTAVVAILAVASVATKSDIILCFGMFGGLAFYFRKLTLRTMLVSVAIPVVAFAATNLYTHVITSGLAGLGDSVGTWAGSFPFTIEALTDDGNRSVLVNTAGRALTAVIVLATAYCLIRSRHRRLSLIVLLWALPPILFWGLKMGNSARHMMSAYTALLGLSSVMWVSVFRTSRSRWIAVGVVVVANYFLGPSVGGTISPASRLFELAPTVKEYGTHRHVMGELWAGFDVERKFYVGRPTNPYITWETLVRSSSFTIISRKPLVYRLCNGKCTLFRVEEIGRGETMGPSEEWCIATFEDDKRAANYSRFAGDLSKLEAMVIRAGDSAREQ